MFQSTHPRRVRQGSPVALLRFAQFQSTHPRRVRRCKTRWTWDSHGFNPRTHAGCDVTIKHIRASNVSIHAPTQGATVSMAPSRWLYIAFQSTHPRRVRRDGGDRYYDSSDVSIHAPTQGATNNFSGHLASSLSFNPRTHAGCDFVRLEHRAARVVSIHAPTQGATLGLVGRKLGQDVSIHAPTQGATPNLAAGVRLVSIHAPTQGATRKAPPTVRHRHVSIHAPTGCDVPSIRLHRCVLRFNPRTHAGCDGDTAEPDGAPAQFQSTHPRRVRHAGDRLRVGQLGVSIHAPTQGQAAVELRGVSIHAPTQVRLPLRNPFILQQKRDVCEPHPGQFKTPRCRHHLSYRQTKQALTKSRTSTGKRHATYGSQDSLKHQGRIQIQHRLRTHMLDPIAPLPTQIVEPQTVLGRVDRFL